MPLDTAGLARVTGLAFAPSAIAATQCCRKRSRTPLASRAPVERGVGAAGKLLARNGRLRQCRALGKSVPAPDPMYLHVASAMLCLGARGDAYAPRPPPPPPPPPPP
eukprot:gene6500-6258_t